MTQQTQLMFTLEKMYGVKTNAKVGLQHLYMWAQRSYAVWVNTTCQCGCKALYQFTDESGLRDTRFSQMRRITLFDIWQPSYYINLFLFLPFYSYVYTNLLHNCCHKFNINTTFKFNTYRMTHELLWLVGNQTLHHFFQREPVSLQSLVISSWYHKIYFDSNCQASTVTNL